MGCVPIYSKKAQDMLNDRPRKTLGFLTPHEVFSKLLH